MKPTRISFIAILCAAIVFLGAVFYNKGAQNANIAGHRAFAESYNKLSEKSKIVLNDGQRSYTFSLVDDMWRLEEKDFYYVDYDVMNFLFSTLENSIVYSYEENENDGFEFVPEWRLEIFYDGKLQDFAMIKKNAEGRYLTKLGNDEKIHQISGYFDFPHSYMLWLKQPLISLNEEDVMSINIDGKHFYRKIPNGKFYSDSEYDEDYLAAVVEEFANFDFIDVKKYSEDNDKSDSVSIVAEMFDGRVYEIEMYKSADKYYATAKLSNTDAPMMGTREYVENNKILYDGWIFEILPEVYTMFSALR